MASFSGTSRRKVTVRFLVDVGSGALMPEPDPTAVQLGVHEYHRVRGAIEISVADLPTSMPQDELVPLVQNLCFNAVRDVVATEHAVAGYLETYGYVRLDLEGDLVRVSGDDVPDIRVEAVPLLTDLVNCGGRFCPWLERLRLDGDLELIVSHLRDGEASARAALDEYVRRHT